MYFLQQCLNGVQVSAFYAMLAVGYVLIHAVTHRVNLAIGAVAMWGGHVLVLTATALSLRWFLPDAQALLLAALAALCACLALGLVLARWVVGPLAHRSGLAMLIATIGVAIVLEEAARFMSGSRELWLAPVLAERIVLFNGPAFPLVVTAMQAVNVAAAALLIGGVLALLAFSSFGRLWRAVADDAGMARLLGVDVGRVVTASVAAGCGLAGAAGALSAIYYGNASFHLGLILGLKVLYVVILGGLNRPAGAVGGAALLGFFETLWSAYFPIAWRDVASFAALTALLALRPAGLFSARERIDHAR
jgi:branched-chain amino acid transport system permease protein